ncbi:MAG: aldose 1-epimerase [Acidobacteriota bacterium]
MTDYQTYHHNRNYGCRLTEFIYEGYRAITLENEKLRVTVLADKGTDIFEFLYKPQDVDFMWRTREGLRPRYLPQHIRGSGTFMDNYEGGWQELFPNCGNFSTYQGAEIGQHGEIAALPWRYTIIKDEVDEIAVRFEVRAIRTPFHLAKTLTLKRHEAILRIHERVTNEGGQPAEFIWGHHPALGHPFIDESCRVDAPPCRIRTMKEYTGETSRLVADQNSKWPLGEGREDWSVDLSKIPPPEVESADMIFLEGIADGWFAVTNTDKRVGFAMRYPAEIFKVLWYWQIFRGGRNYPWWSATYNIALEPCVALPKLHEAVSNGEALMLEAGESLAVELLAIAYEGISMVERVAEDGSIIGG